MKSGSRSWPWTVGFTLLAVTTSSNLVAADEPISLKGAMARLKLELNQASDGLLASDMKAVAQAARVMSQRQPVAEAERVRLIALLGPQIEQYERIELVVRNTAQRLAEAAEREDRREALATYFRLMDSCITCHREYRKPVAKALAATRVERAATQPITDGDPLSEEGAR